MKVEAVQMYRAGVRIPDDELRLAQAVGGELTLGSHSAELHRLPAAPPGASDPARYSLPPLAWARITRVTGNRLIVTGFQLNSRATPGEQPQAWLCTLVEE